MGLKLGSRKSSILLLFLMVERSDVLKQRSAQQAIKINHTYADGELRTLMAMFKQHDRKEEENDYNYIILLP